MRNLKRVLALALALVMVIGMMVMGTSAASYTDAESITADYVEAVDVMSGVGMFEGTDGEFNPDEVLTRAQAAALLARLNLGKKTADKLVATKQIFTDVAVDAWYAGEVEYCYQTGLIDGLGNGTFAPDAPLTGVAFAKLILVAIGYDADAAGYVGKDWSANISVDALKNGLIVDGVLLAADVTREVAAQMLFQALTVDTVYYETAYDKATGAPVLVGPKAVTTTKIAADYDTTGTTTDATVQFCEKYFSTLKLADDYADNWGRPCDHYWYSGKTVLYVEMKTPVATYTEQVAECDIAADLGLRASAAVSKLTVNSVDTAAAALFGTDSKITLTSTRPSVGAQGQLVEVYNVGTPAVAKYEVVVIDTYLAKVTDVEVVEYDKNGHIDEYAELDLAIYTGFNTATEITLYAAADYEYSKNDMLLVYYDANLAYSALLGEYTEYAEVVAYADSIVGTQSAYVFNADSHIVEDVEYLDAAEFNLDQAGTDALNNHTWYFDQYGNLIGVADVRTSSTYATISSIYWQNSFGGERGFANAVLTYMDGTQEAVKVAAIWKDNAPSATPLTSTNGAGDYEKGWVSTTIQYNETFYKADGTVDSAASDYTNVALYQVIPGYYGATLVEVDSASVAIETGVPKLANGVVAGQSTQFLVWDEYYEEYETYTGIRNVPTYDGTTTAYYVKGIDGIVDYIFVIDPAAADENTTATYYYNGPLSVKTYLYYTYEYYYVITGGYVNGEKAAITTFDADVVATIENDCQNTLVKLSLKNGYVEKVENWADNAVINVVTNAKADYAGAIDAGTTATTDDATLADGILTIGGVSYDVADAAIINAYRCSLEDLFEEIEDGDIDPAKAFVYVIYTEGKVSNKINKVASLIYVSTTAPGTVGKTASDAAEAALDEAQATAAAELKAYINSKVKALDANLTNAADDATTEIGVWNGDAYKTMAKVVETWTGELYDETKRDTPAEVNAHLDTLKGVFDRAGAAAKYVEAVEDLAALKVSAGTATALKDALNNAADGTVITLTADITVEEALVLNAADAKVTLDLAGKKLISDQTAIKVTAGTLTITGDGKVIGGKGGNYTAVTAQGGSVVIKNGTFYVGADANGEGNSCIYNHGVGTITVEGGTFESAAKYDGTYWVLNINNGDAAHAKIIVTGGTFKGFNPDAPDTDDHASYVANGYKVVEEDGVYTVVEI